MLQGCEKDSRALPVAIGTVDDGHCGGVQGASLGGVVEGVVHAARALRGLEAVLLALCTTVGGGGRAVVVASEKLGGLDAGPRRLLGRAGDGFR